MSPGARTVLLVGYHGAGNAGDDLILEVVASELRRRRPGLRLWVPAQDPDRVALEGVDPFHWLDTAALAWALERADAVVVGGGGVLHDYGPTHPERVLSPLQHRLTFFAGVPWIAGALGLPVGFLAVGAGPLQWPESRDLVRLAAARARVLTVRDAPSAEVLAACGVVRDRIEVTADPAWLAAPRPGEGGAPPGRWIGVALRPWAGLPGGWTRALADGLERLARHLEAGILLVPFQRMAGALEDDLAVARRLRRELGGVPAEVLEVPHDASPRRLAAALAGCELVVAMRYHAVLAALAAGVPTVALAYDPKVAALAEDPDLEVPPELVPLHRLDADELVARSRAALDRPRPGGTGPRRLRARAVAALDRIGGLLAGARRRPPERWAVELVRSARTTALRARRAGTDLAAVERALVPSETPREPPPAPPADDPAARYLRRLVALRLTAASAVLAHRSAVPARPTPPPPPSRPLATGNSAEDAAAWRRAWLEAMEHNRYLTAELERWRSSRAWRAVTAYWRLHHRLARLAAALLPRPRSRRTAPAPAPAVSPPRELPGVPRGRYDVLVLSIIDWEFRFQRPQQLAAQFGRHGHRVVYLSTSRFLRRSDPRPARLRPLAPGVVEARLRSPRPLDVYRDTLPAPDTAALADAVDELAHALRFGDTVVMVQVPSWAPLAEELRRRHGWRVVYDCMDEWSHFPGFSRAVVAQEERLVREADLTVVTAQSLRERLAPAARRLLLAPNAVDTEHYRRRYRPNDLLRGHPRPVIGYFGALASWVDVPLLERIADEFPAASLVLAGGEFDVDLSGLRRRSNVTLLGQRPYDEMPELLWQFDVCIIPFRIDEVTHATNPVKLYEYCFSGKPIVAPDLRELRPFADVCYLAATRDEFIAHLRAALAEPEDDPRRERRRRIAAANDWSERYRAIDAALREAYPLVSVIVVTHGGWEHTRRCLASLLEGETWPRLEVIVVDNASPDATPDRLLELARRDPRLRTILNPGNRGFAAANNQGIAAARGEVVILLNNDTVVPPGLVGRLVHHLETDPTIGLVCPTTNFCGNEARVEPWYATLDELPAYAAWRALAHRGATFELDVAAMYCAAARREVLERVGPLDEGFGLGMFEDDDYSRRVRLAGYRVVCAEDAYVHHVGQAAFGRLPEAEYRRLWETNQRYFERKWSGGEQPPQPR